MSKTLFILNGPNLNMLGMREPELYGHDTLDMIRERCEKRAANHALAVDFRQTNYEGTLVESIQEAREKAAAIIINPAGLSFFSVPVLDALKMFAGPIVEIHLTNIHKRDAIYQKSLVSTVATVVICGLGANGYLLAVDAAADLVGR